MNIEEIKKEIKSKVTGDLDIDAPYLREMKEKYNYEHGYEELLEWIDELIVREFLENENIVPDKTEGDAYRDAITKASYYRQEHQYDKAASIMRKQIRQFAKYVNDNEMHDSGKTVFRDFDEEFERTLYLLDHRDEEVVQVDNIPVVEMYLEYFDALYVKGDYEGAKKILAKAKRWNPVSFRIAYYEAVLCKKAGDLEQFLQKTKDAFRCAYKSGCVALLECNLAYYFIEKGLYEEAWYCYDHALVYDQNCSLVDKGMDMIEALTNGEVKDLVGDRMEEISKQYDVPYGYDDRLDSVAYYTGRYLLEERKDYDKAEYYLRIGWNLTDRSDYMDLLKIIDQKR